MQNKRIYSVAIIGAGYAGKRFVRAFRYRQNVIGDVKVVAVCDKSMQKLSTFKGYEIKIYSDVNDMLSSDKFDIIVVASNEESHYRILLNIFKKKQNPKRIIVEKLLTKNIKQSLAIQRIFKNFDISIHFVERHSQVISEAVKWLLKHNLEVRRGFFFWGKYRLHDHRPTIGVISEISHPIDLILFISKISIKSHFKIVKSCCTFSDYSCSGKNILDTINVNIKFGKNLFINGSSSFLWGKRDRRIMLYLSKPDSKISYIVEFSFDNPRWDIDVCTISSINKSANLKKIIKKWETKEKKDIKELCGIEKIYNFIDENIKEIKNKKYSQSLAHLEQGCYVQNVVESLMDDAKSLSVSTPIFKK